MFRQSPEAARVGETTAEGEIDEGPVPAAEEEDEEEPLEEMEEEVEEEQV